MDRNPSDLSSPPSSYRTADTEHYGSDFGEEGEQLLADLLDSIEVEYTESQTRASVGPNIEPQFATDLLSPLSAAERDDAAEQSLDEVVPSIEGVQEDFGNSVFFPRTSIAVVRSDSPGRIVWDPSLPSPAEDQKSPLERFRTTPRKPMSVTDLVSPAWCEIQYLYSLSRFGKVRATPAMQRGTSVHKELEEQVHTTVPVDVITREDHWGLKLWNVIQGLRTLRVTGMTRELEIFGTLDGQVITGVIDELGYKCPDPKLEATVKPSPTIPESQTTISAFFAGDDQKLQDGHHVRAGKKVYITDVKTRNSSTLPNAVSVRPARIQLMLYRKLLIKLAANEVEADKIFERFRVDPDASFSNEFIDQLSELDFNFSPTATQESTAPVESTSDVISELIFHNSLKKLWMLMITEYRKTIESDHCSIGEVLNIEYRASNGGAFIGNKAFLYDDSEIENYIDDEMNMWRGKRAARGVDIEEAFKCRICEFADDCGWRKSKIDEVVSKSRARQSARAGK